MSFGQRLKEARTAKNFTQKQLGNIIGARHNSISNWEHDLNFPDAATIDVICRTLSISASYLISGSDCSGLENFENIHRLNPQRIPILGEIACGMPIYCNREYENYIETDSDIHADFALIAKGDSMINARIHDGDAVFIRTQPTVENGEIAAVCIDDEATLKRVYISGDTVTLIAENPSYPPIVYNLADSQNIRILGKAIAFQSRL